MDVLFVDDNFHPIWEIYFAKQGIVKPVKDTVYTVREVVPNTIGGPGFLLNEIVNRPTRRISPLTGMEGMSEQNWAVRRFRTLSGDVISEEMIREMSRVKEHSY